MVRGNLTRSDRGPPNLQSVCSWAKRPTANHSRDLCQTCIVISFHVALFSTMRLVDTAPWYKADEDNSRPTTFGPQLWVLLHWFASLGSERQEFLTFHLYWNSLPSLVCVCVCVEITWCCAETSRVYFVVVQSLSYVRLCNPMDYATPGSSVLHYLPEFAQVHGHWISDAI